jgi:hypothetical protein
VRTRHPALARSLLLLPLLLLPLMSYASTGYDSGRALTDLAQMLVWMRDDNGSRVVGGMLLAGLAVGTIRGSGALWLDALPLAFVLANVPALPMTHWPLVASTLVLLLMTWIAEFIYRCMMVLRGRSEYWKDVLPAPLVLAESLTNITHHLWRRRQISRRRARRREHVLHAREPA